MRRLRLRAARGDGPAFVTSEDREDDELICGQSDVRPIRSGGSVADHVHRTTPPIAEIVDFLLHRFRQNRLLCAVQVHEAVDPDSLAELQTRVDWSALRV